MALDLIHLEYDVLLHGTTFSTGSVAGVLPAFLTCLKAVCCSAPDSICQACPQLEQCRFHFLCAQQLSSDPDIVRLHQKPSLPFSLHVRSDDTASSILTVGLVVIGTAIPLLSLLHKAMLSFLAGHVHQQNSLIPRIYSLDYLKDRDEIVGSELLDEQVVLLSAQHILDNTLHASHVKVLLNTPLVLNSHGVVNTVFDFSTFLRTQMRRCSSLWAYYGTGSLDLDFKGISRAAEQVMVLESTLRYGKLPGMKPFGRAGLLGSVECDGLVEPMYALLQLGSYFNAGKGAGYGAGDYHLEPLSS